MRPFPLARPRRISTLDSVPDSFDNLPSLTPDQAAVVGVMISPHEPIHDLAAAIDMPLSRFFDLLAAPAVQTHLAHIRKSLDQRVKIRLAEAAHKAVDVLERVAASPVPQGNPNVAPLNGETIAWQIERRRAATTTPSRKPDPRARAR